MSLKIMSFFGREKEKEVIEKISEFMNEIEETKEIFLQCCKSFIDEKYKEVEELSQEIKSHEINCDKIFWDIKMKLFSGAFLPNTRPYLNNLCLKMDDVVDNMHYSSEMFVYMKNKKFPEEIKNIMWKLIEENVHAVEQLLIILEKLFEQEKEIMGEIKLAKQMEQNADKLKKEIYDLIYDKKKINEISSRLIIDIATLVCNVSDAVEECGHEIIILKLIQQA